MELWHIQHVVKPKASRCVFAFSICRAVVVSCFVCLEILFVCGVRVFCVAEFFYEHDHHHSHNILFCDFQKNSGM